MSLDTTTLTETNIPSLAARNVEQRMKTLLDAVQVAVDAFFVSQGMAATFWDDGTGDVLELSADAIALLGPVVANSFDRFIADYWTDEETRLNAAVMTVFPESADPIIEIDHV